MNFPANLGTVVTAAAGRVMTQPSDVNTIGYVSPRIPQLLTKRRAVDFCLVATAICCAVPGAAD